MEHIIIHNVVLAQFYNNLTKFWFIVLNSSFREPWCKTPNNESIFGIQILTLTIGYDDIQVKASEFI